MSTHISRKHTNYIESDVPLKCEICVEEFKTEKDLKDHAITHTYSKSEFLKFKCYECDFWGPTAQTMKMHFRRVHSENISCGICNLEVKDIETLDIHTFTCERFQCNWCAKSFNNELNELAKKLEKIEKVELEIQKRIEAYEEQIERNW